MWFFSLKLKSQAAATFVKFKQVVENQFNTKIKTLYLDNGREFIALHSFLADQGISHITTPPHIHRSTMAWHNGDIIILWRLVCHYSHALGPTQYWTYGFAGADYLINPMPTNILPMDSLYLLLFGASPNYSKLHVFGCLCYMWLRPYTTNKLQPRSTPCVFFGYSLTQSAFLCFDPSSSCIFVSRHVNFVKTQLPFASLTSIYLPHTDSQEVP